ncbi:MULTISPECIES: response regulator transcription factor [Subtercola]|uniref:DNA-binding response regulator n=1 Tax=Subtercola vilae TaxID=2056433 RepID=A0A4T2BYY8_9MICO|nr:MULTISPECIES: response regulator transcription factor [Subtercola]MEA9985572.1 response regulator transcription factor [Subtercola sp. RTI3]TIH36322.1 DNA-binding response regulator [Subtercola vilae]
MTADRIRVLVVDDQAIVRDGLVTVLALLPDIDVVGEAADGEEAVQRAAELRPDVVLIDLRMPVLGGTEATARIVAERPATAVLVLTTFADDESLLGALRVGARGYLTKDASRAEVASAIRAVANGQTTFGPEIGAKLIDSFTQTNTLTPQPAAASSINTAAGIQSRFPQLTPREAGVLQLITEGLNNPEIAARLFVSVATVKTHINSIFTKLPARDRAQAITRAQEL